MKIMNKVLNPSIIAKVLMVLSVLVFMYYIFLVVTACSYVNELIIQKEIILPQNFDKVFQYVMTQSFAYLFYAIALFVFSYLVNRTKAKT